MTRQVLQDLEMFSQIEIGFELLGEDTSLTAEILKINVVGNYRDGSQGDQDAKFIIDTMKKVSQKYESNAYILDLTGLRYSFGDYFDSIYSSPAKGRPIVILPGEKCIEGMASLEGVPLEKFIDNKEFFANESVAIEFLKTKKTTTNNR